MKILQSFFYWLINKSYNMPIGYIYCSTCSGGDGDDSHPEDNDYNGGSSYDGW